MVFEVCHWQIGVYCAIAIWPATDTISQWSLFHSLNRTPWPASSAYWRFWTVQYSVSRTIYIFAIWIIRSTCQSDTDSNVYLVFFTQCSSESFCWSFMIDVFICMASVIALIVFNKISTMDRSNNIEDSCIINNIFGRNKQLKSKSHTILKAIGNFITIDIKLDEQFSVWMSSKTEKLSYMFWK